MDSFIIRFLFCNLILCLAAGVLLIVKRMCNNSVTRKTHYYLWMPLLILMLLPFFPYELSVLDFSRNLSSSISDPSIPMIPTVSIVSDTVINDFALSVYRLPDIMTTGLLAVWIGGTLIMTCLLMISMVRLHSMSKHAVPLRDKRISSLFAACCTEAKINGTVPLYVTDDLDSPAIAGIFRAHIFLPASIVRNYDDAQLRYMLLHELIHYRRHDTSINLMTNILKSLYWFDPVIRYVLNRVRLDQELACDEGVLELLNDNEHPRYGMTLISLSESISCRSVSAASYINSGMKKMRQRISCIAGYAPISSKKRSRSHAVFIAILILTLCCAPVLNSHAVSESTYDWDNHSAIIQTDMDSYFGSYDGSFILYDASSGEWKIHNINKALKRVSPDSTYKIYTALAAMDSGLISPGNTTMTWDGTIYPFDAWNSDQDLHSAMADSVNWYFQDLDMKLGKDRLTKYFKRIEYGNCDLYGDISSYWMESSLKISPVEQILLLERFHNNQLGFSRSHTDIVKKSLKLGSSSDAQLYGKTGTGRVNDRDINGWFIGFIEKDNNTFYFAANIQSDSEATGNAAAEITFDILKDMDIWK